MTLVKFIRIFNRNLNLFLLSSIVMAVVVYFLTKNAPETYKSEMEIFTGITSGTNLISLGEARIDYNAANTAYDNLINTIKSKRTLEEVGYRLLYRHMMLDSANPRIISRENYNHFRYKISQELEDQLLVPGSEDSTVENIRNYRFNNLLEPKVELTFNRSGSPYSYQAIKNIKAKRVQNSDLLELSYSFNDPGITQQTLEILYQVFIDNMAQIKGSQTADVVEYFRKKVEEASEELAVKELQLKQFKIKNNIINYEHQTKSISVQKEKLEDEYQKEIAVKESAEAALKKLDKQLALNKMIIKFGSEILAKRQKLADMKTKITSLEIFYNQPETISKLKAEAEKLKAELSNSLMKRYEYGRTKEGIDKEVLLTQWLDYTLKLDEAKARIKIFEKRKKYFRDTYNEFAPLGSDLKRMKRTIDVAERNYLELLDSYNTALLKQRSEKLSSSGTQITVPPYYPTDPEPSKTTLLILVAAVVGFMVPLVFVILIEFLDSTIQTPLRGEELTGLKILGALPNYRKRLSNRQVNFPWLHQKAMGLLSQNLRLEVRHRQVDLKRPKYILCFSTRNEDGKTTATHFLANELVSLNRKVLVLYPKELPEEYEPYYEKVTYPVNKEMVNTTSISELLNHHNPALYDYVFMVLQPIITEPYPLDLLKEFHITINIVGAYRSWGKADIFALKEFEKVLPAPPRLIVNGVDPDDMNIVLGEISKSRSALRKFLKGLFNLEFKTGKARKVKRKNIQFKKAINKSKNKPKNGNGNGNKS